MKIQKHEFQVDLHVLPIRGADVVLGVQWLKALGLVLTDYTAMKFIYNDQLIELVGDRDSSLQMISPSQLRRLVDTGNTSTFFHIKMEPSLETPINITHPLPAVQQLLSKYASLFQPLSTYILHLSTYSFQNNYSIIGFQSIYPYSKIAYEMAILEH